MIEFESMFVPSRSIPSAASCLIPGRACTAPATPLTGDFIDTFVPSQKGPLKLLSPEVFHAFRRPPIQFSHPSIEILTLYNTNVER